MKAANLNPPSTEQVQAALARILSSDSFNRAPGLKKFLEFICTETLQGRGDNLKEYNIAVDGLGRAPAFDQKKDSIVRVQALKLRKRLQEYYETEGAADPVRIVLSEGSYLPEFHLIAQEPEPDLPSPPKRRISRWLIPTLAGLLTLIASAAVVWTLRTRSTAPARTAAISPSPKPKTQPIPITPPDDAVRILAGRGPGRHLDSDGFSWEGDRFFTGGEVLPTPANVKVRASDPDLFAAARKGEVKYDIPVGPGLWELHLFFAETEYGQDNLKTDGEATREFGILCNGVQILKSFDIYMDAGDADLADEKIFPGISAAPDGMLHLRFNGESDWPILNAIEVVRSTGKKMNPLRMVCLRHAHRGLENELWLSDRYVRGGVLVARATPTAWLDPELCRGERFGRFRYDIPVVPGTYTVNLYFTETWFGTTATPNSGPGSRIFDVAINGHPALHNFDILKETGHSGKTMRKSFPHIAANASQKITLDFEPIVNYALINAIEILPE